MKSKSKMKNLLLFLVVGVLMLNFAGCGWISSPENELNALFKNPQQLKAGDPVQLAGVKVGRVKSIAPHPVVGRLRVTMAIQRSVIVKTDSTATIAASATPGTSLIILSSGSPRAPRATDGTYLPSQESK
jgi:ABC-type transporter Mla subunit MlaD